MVLATAYDVINTAIFLPSGGSRRVRQVFVEALDVRAGQRVLELGCGTGLVTAPLLAAGAAITAVDALPAMLARARQRAPGATFIEGDALTADIGDNYDRVVFSFVLHNFDAGDRTRLLRRAASALAAGGRIGILDWAVPSGRVRAALWRRFLRALEPAQGATQQILDGALDQDLPAAGLRVDDRHRAAGGRAQILIATMGLRSTPPTR